MNWLTRSRKFHVKHPDSDTADRSLEGSAPGTEEAVGETSVEAPSVGTDDAAGSTAAGRRRETFIPAVTPGTQPGDLAAALQRTAGLPTAATERAKPQDRNPGEEEIALEIAPVAPDAAETTSSQSSSAPASAPATPGFDDSTPLARELADITRRRRAVLQQELPLPAATRIFTVANQKGGVGKTTSTVNLAAALARQGARVLVIDLDPQGNASTGLGVEHRSDTASVYDVIINDVPMADVIQKSPEFDALFVVPATIHLAGAEIELVSLVAREQRLRTSLDAFLAATPDEFHYVFIDCPPSLGLLTINAFVAAREVLIPIQCEYYALEGLSQLLNNIKLIEKHLNPTLSVSTILLTMYDSRTNLANQVADDVRKHFPAEVLDTLIPRSVRISEAPGYGQSVISYDPGSPGSLSYLEAAGEIARRGASA
jgi:chromosome partitioning protein